MKIQPIVAGNWKMHKTPKEGSDFIDKSMNLLLDIQSVSVIFAPPFTGLFDMDVAPPFFSAAQNCHWESQGAFTGEISVEMIVESGADYVILGHSERRHVFGESDDWVNRKVLAVLKGGLKPILCIGETIEQRQAGQTALVLKSQLTQGLNTVESLENIIVAYEPVWAIGTGETASVQQIEEAHASVFSILSEMYPDAESVPILYGGSVKKENSEELIQVPGVNGFLIGGASLEVDSFTSIVKIVENVQMRTT